MFSLIKTKEVELIRRDAGTYNDLGDYEKGHEYTLSIVAHVQPLKYHETLLLPESERTKKACKIYTKATELRSLNESDDGHDADMFYWQNDLYEIVKLQTWDVQTTYCDHYCAYAVRVEQTPDEVI